MKNRGVKGHDVPLSRALLGIVFASICGCVTHAVALSRRTVRDDPVVPEDEELEALWEESADDEESLPQWAWQAKQSMMAETLRKISALREAGSASSSYGKLLTTKDSPTPSAVCLPQSGSHLPWIRLMLRLSGRDREQWNEFRDRLVYEYANSLDTISGNIPEFLSSSGASMVKSVVVRDPVTHVLWIYLETCRSGGNWRECLSTDGRPISFEEMLTSLRQAGTDAAPDSLKQQLDACNLRNQHFDVVGSHEDPQFTAQAVLTKLGKYTEFGDRGWGELGDAAFSDLFPMDRTDDKVCDFYTPELLEIVHHAYRNDYEAFGYNIKKWSQKCTEEWGAKDAADAGSTHLLPTPGKYDFPSYDDATKCTATTEELRRVAKGPDTVARQGPAMKFYIHEHGDFDFDAITHCFLRLYDMDTSTDDWDDHVHANISEHLGEVWLLKAMRSHPQRTMNVAEADVHVIGALPFVSYVASLPSPSGSTCGTPEEHEQRMKRVADSLVQLESFKQSNGRNFFTFTTYFRIPEAYTEPLLSVLHQGNVIVGTADMDYTHWKLIPKIRRKVILPYKAHYVVENAAFDRSHDAPREMDFLFRGKMGRANEGSSRDTMWKVMDNSERKVDIQNVFFFDSNPASSDELAQLYCKTNFCMAPSGDSPTSRRLFDSMACGCVPLAFSNIDRLTRNLPFTRTIDWSKMVWYTGSLACLSDDLDTTKNWLRSISDPQHAELLRSMRSAGLEAFRGALSYSRNGAGMVTALMAELAHELAEDSP